MGRFWSQVGTQNRPKIDPRRHRKSNAKKKSTWKHKTKQKKAIPPRAGPGPDRPQKFRDGHRDGRLDLHLDGRLNGRLDGRHDGRHDGRRDGRCDGRHASRQPSRRPSRRSSQRPSYVVYINVASLPKSIRIVRIEDGYEYLKITGGAS